MKKILYIDMDNVLVDFPSGISKLSQEVINEYESNLDEVPNIFSLMEPLEGAIDSFKILSQRYDTYILSTAPWKNSSAWSDKVKWVKKYLGESAYKRLILTHHKNLNHGDYLIDDRTKNGAGEFNQAQLKKETAPKLAKLVPGLTEDLVKEMQKTQQNCWVMYFIGFHWILNWWRRGESNPRPKGVNRRRLHAYSLI